MNENQTQLIEIERLEKSPLNARRTVKRDGFEELKASVLAHGLMQNLVVTENGDGLFYVVASARRLEAMRELQKEGSLPEGFAVPCQVVSGEQALELSLAENTVRVAMHPADEFEAFAELAESGHTTAQIAERFGVEEKHVRQRMKLARVAPELLTQYREEELDLECLMAFTLTDDHDRQLEVYRSVREWDMYPHTIRRLLTKKAVEADSKLARFVGLETYEAAGGSSRRDLFGERVYLEDPELLQRLASEKLEEARSKLLADGWGWVEVNPQEDYSFIGQCTRICPTPLEPPDELLAEKEKAEATVAAIREEDPDANNSDLNAKHDAAEDRLAEIEAQLAEHVTFDPDEMKSAGCYVSIDHNGALSIQRGLVRKEDQKQLAKSKGSKADEPAAEEKPKDRMPETLKRDLEAYRLQVAQAEIARHAAIAFDLLVFHAACGVLDCRMPFGAPDVEFKQSYAKPSVEPETTAAARFEEFHDLLPLKWLNKVDPIV